MDERFTAGYWDARYGSTERVWSGNPNRQLVAEAAGGNNPAGLLVHLIRSGWTPPAPLAPDDDEVDWDLLERLGLGGRP